MVPDEIIEKYTEKKDKVAKTTTPSRSVRTLAGIQNWSLTKVLMLFIAFQWN